jgi:hypothetical protein
MKALLAAYEKSSANDKAQALRKKLMIWRIPSVEEAMVFPELHSKDSAVQAKK